MVGSHLAGMSKNAELPGNSAASAQSQLPPLNKEVAAKFLFKAVPGAEQDGGIILAAYKDKNGVRALVNHFLKDQGSDFIRTHGKEATVAMVSKLTGIPAEKINTDTITRCMLNALFIEGSESGNKLKEMLDNNGTVKDLENLINERLKEFEKYVQDPSKLPDLAVPAAENPVAGSRKPVPGPYKCEVDIDRFAKDGDTLQMCGNWISSPEAGSYSVLSYAQRLDPAASSVADMLETVGKYEEGKIAEINSQRSDGDYIERTKMDAYIALDEIANDFVSKFGHDAVIKILNSVGCKYDPENTTHVLELGRVIFANFPNMFDGHRRILSGLGMDDGVYRDNIACLADIFVDGLNTYAQKLGLQPLNK